MAALRAIASPTGPHLTESPAGAKCRLKHTLHSEPAQAYHLLSVEAYRPRLHKDLQKNYIGITRSYAGV